jgi:hypothetical protein
MAVGQGMAAPVQETQEYPFWLKATFLAFVCLTMVVLAEAVSQFILYQRYGATYLLGIPTGDESIVYDPLLGWRGRPRARIRDHYGPDKNLTYNSAGLRSPRDHDEHPGKGQYRIICIGDSFTQGWGVDDEHTYPAWIERLEPRLETINMGMGAYGIDQAYLRYQRDAARYRADMLILAVISNDFDRMGRDTFKMQRFKPWLAIAPSGSLEVRGVPVPNLSRDAGNWFSKLPASSALYQFWRRIYSESIRKPDVWALATAVFADLQRIAGERGQRFVLVYFPTLSELRRAQEGLPLPLAEQCAEWSRRSNVEFVDVKPAFDPVPKSELDSYFSPPHDPHYSEEGNRLVAMTLLKRLFPAGLPNPARSTQCPAGPPE